jgi:uncharacterized lipoprotein YmbA
MKLPTTPRPRPLARLALVCAVGLVAGCNVVPPAQDDPTRYYVLSDSAPAAPQAGPSQGGARIGLRAVQLEGYLRRREMVVRTGSNEVEFRDYRRWAEPLDAAIARILQARLQSSPAVAQAWVEPFPVDQDRDFDVSVAVSRCEGSASRSDRYVASLSATIEVSTAGPNAHVVARRVFAAPDAAWNGSDYERLAALLSADVAQLAQEVLAAVPAKN